MTFLLRFGKMEQGVKVVVSLGPAADNVVKLSQWSSMLISCLPSI